MNYSLNDEQKILKDTARSFFTEELKSSLVREVEEDEQGYSRKLWESIAEFGWMGTIIPEEFGGFEATFFELSLILEEMGYAGYAGPFFSTVVLGALTILTAGTPEQKRSVLEEVSLGKRLMTLALEETGDGPSACEIATTAKKVADGFLLNGCKRFVPFAHVADTIICAARTGDGGKNGEEGISLFLVDRRSQGVSIEVLNTIARDKQCDVVFNNVLVSGDSLLGEAGEGWQLLQGVLRVASVAKCAEMVGGARKVLEMVVEYAKTRKQFGQPIGSFQAIQHHCANMLTCLDSSALLTFYASKRIGQGLSYEKEAAMCKAWVSDSYRKLTALGHQVMGGVGFIDESDLQIYFRRAKAAEQALGDATYHREIVAQLMGL
ncbi:acyl-CoA dehydrogenase [Geobacter metallireducens GS-15]|uniref:Acyl-CoA dehydrogenase n=1 Tax=Geobacter metallireducens (strain ATCC 53774 / DSM 7210 / GS-15) TaxID=269799 RepID=Q39TJ9_GEOMG|nr:acyl-CoA dehydrogenase [Geobacter metallireducens]ABB32425.1 acyl-CoA dehydrogenase [Geobacter metallireducens GS-15]